MGKFIDLTGQKFGRLTVISRSNDYVSPKGQHHPQWLCRCECGNECVVSGNNLKRGNTNSCGCYGNEMASKANLTDLSGHKFGRLTVIERAKNKGEKVYWKCQCDCGNIKDVEAYRLTHGLTQSCGCYNMELIRQRSDEKIEDLTGKRFGKLVVLEKYGHKGRCITWKCQCDCGNETVVFGGALRDGKTKSCGCLRHQESSRIIDMCGMKFGMLTVIDKSESINGVAAWRCKCDCGNETVVRGYSLRNLSTISCGCFSQSKGELIIEQKLNNLNIKFEKQKKFSDCRDKNSLPFDFFVPSHNMCIEFDGEQHYRPVEYFGGNDAFSVLKMHDEIKDEYCKNHGIKLVRISYEDFDNIENILSRILN